MFNVPPETVHQSKKKCYIRQEFKTFTSRELDFFNQQKSNIKSIISNDGIRLFFFFSASCIFETDTNHHRKTSNIQLIFFAISICITRSCERMRQHIKILRSFKLDKSICKRHQNVLLFDEKNSMRYILGFDFTNLFDLQCLKIDNTWLVSYFSIYDHE